MVYLTCFNNFRKISISVRTCQRSHDEKVAGSFLNLFFQETNYENAQILVEAGFDYVCDFEEVKLFKKRK